jgi:nucleotide-binding universal stress UspA family protein
LEEHSTFGFFKTKTSRQEFEKESKLVEKQYLEMKNFANKYGVSINSKIIKNGDVPEKILNFAEQHDVDLIIMGRKKFTTPNERMNYYSTVESVSRNADCSLLIVH